VGVLEARLEHENARLKKLVVGRNLQRVSMPNALPASHQRNRGGISGPGYGANLAKLRPWVSVVQLGDLISEDTHQQRQLEGPPHSGSAASLIEPDDLVVVSRQFPRCHGKLSEHHPLGSL
jgi:hypothetical protein